MAGAASSSSSASPSKKQFDVFVSFRGEDTRRNFTSHLYAALSRKKIQTYKDDRNLKKGEEVWPALVHAIDNSYLCILVFSEDYASSTWCLRELTHILESKREKEVIPVFYQIKPTDVRKQTGSYEKAFKNHEKNPQLRDEVVRKWRVSLQKASNFSGFYSESNEFRDDNDLIENIVRDICQKLEHFYPKSDPKGLVGIDKNYTDIKSLFEKFQVIGLWGMGGIGKTTIARVLFNRYFSQFEGHCFLDNVREKSGNLGHEIRGLRERLFSELLNEPVKPESEVVKQRVSCMKVFIVLDDVNTPEQIEDLLRDICFVPDSRIVITTRDKQVLNRSDYKIYEVKGLANQESFQLFYLNAFDQEHHPQQEFQFLSERAVRYANGLPLALKLLGLFLRNKTKELWECALENLKSCPHNPIDSVLRLSYDELEVEQQDIFLDIAFFFKGERKEDVENFLKACNFPATIGLDILQNKALVTISEWGRVEMHDLIQEMGWEIVRQQCIKDPGRRSRLKDPREICDVLENSKGSDSIEGIILDMSGSGDLQLNVDSFTKMCDLRFFKFYGPGYNELRKVYIPSHTKLIFNKLRYFQWDKWRLQSLPSTFCFNRLVELHMPNSRIKKLWDGEQNPVNLRIINLSGSKRLREFPNLSNSSNLEVIDLSHSNKLRIADLSKLCPPNLEVLNLSYCRKLKGLLSETPLKSLRKLNVKGCLSLKDFSLSSREIKWLDLSYTKIKILPSSIGKCSKLEGLYLPASLKNLPDELPKLRSLWYLGLHCCRELGTGNLHIILDCLLSLDKLVLSGCNLYAANGLVVLENKTLITISDGRVEMDDLIQEKGWKVVCIEDLGRRSRLRNPMEIYDVLENNKGTDEIEGMIVNLSQRQDRHFSDDASDELMNISDSQCLPYVPAILCSKNVARFVMHDAYITKLWDREQNLERLKEINLRGCRNLVELPNLSMAVNLELIDLSYCERLRHLPAICFEKLVRLVMHDSPFKKLWDGVQNLASLEEIDLAESKKLVELPDLSKASKLRVVCLSNCENLCQVHPSLLSLQSLYELNLSGCKNLESLQSGIPLDDLCILDLTHCSSLREFSLSSATKLQTLDLSGTAIGMLDSSIGRYSNLQSLVLSNSQIKHLPDELSKQDELPKLRSLKTLDLAGCGELDSTNLHIILTDSVCLRYLYLQESRVESLPDCIRHNSFLQYINVSYCKRLRSILGLPLSLKDLKADGCTSLEIVKTAAGSSLETSRVEVGTSFLWNGVRMSFKNCESLTPGSKYDIESDAHKRMMAAAACQCDHPIEFCIQGIGVPTWFRYRAERSSTIEVPSDSDTLGFAFCLVLSLGCSLYDGKFSSNVGIECNCWLEGRKIVTSKSHQYFWYSAGEREWISDHVILWYNESHSEAIMNAITDSRAKGASYNPKLSFQFAVSVTKNENDIRTLDAAIKECGVWPIQASEIEYKADVMEEWLEFGRDMDRPAKELKPSFCAKISELEPGTKSYSTSEIGVADAQIKHLTEKNSNCFLNWSSELDISEDEVCSEDASSESQKFIDENELALEADQEELLRPAENLSSNQEIQDKQEQLLQDPTKMQNDDKDQSETFSCVSFICFLWKHILRLISSS